MHACCLFHTLHRHDFVPGPDAPVPRYPANPRHLSLCVPPTCQSQEALGHSAHQPLAPGSKMREPIVSSARDKSSGKTTLQIGWATNPRYQGLPQAQYRKPHIAGSPEVPGRVGQLDTTPQNQGHLLASLLPKRVGPPVCPPPEKVSTSSSFTLFLEESIGKFKWQLLILKNKIKIFPLGALLPHLQLSGPKSL